MRWIITFVALVGLVTASLVLPEHYRTGTSPCKINDVWDCGTVNKSPHSAFHNVPLVGEVPVAAIGIAGYLLLAVLSLRRLWWALVICAAAGLAFSLYLTWIEWKVLETWCIYCVVNVCTILLLTLLALVQAVLQRAGSHPRTAARNAS
jgi:vitamin-K-epoxide reductase (warfarin-sensitive)